MRQNRSGSSHHFSYPAHHFQTLQNTQLLPGDIQMALPVTALVFSQNASLPLNIQHNSQQQQQQHPSYMALLEKQSWYHGKITRKQAENVLANKPIGSFLIRQSESGNLNDFSLSLV